MLAETADPQDAAALLVRLALEHGARDNVSAVVVDVATSAGAHDDVHITVPRTGAELGPYVWDEMLNGVTVPRRARTATKPIPRVRTGTEHAGPEPIERGAPVMSVPEYSAGDWTAVVRPGFVALLGPGAAESTVRALWQDSGEGVFAALALLARDGFGGLPPFAVVSVDGRRVHAALRGDVEVVVDVDGRQDVWRSGEVSTWTERVLDGVADVVGAGGRCTGRRGEPPARRRGRRRVPGPARADRAGRAPSRRRRPRPRRTRSARSRSVARRAASPRPSSTTPAVEPAADEPVVEPRSWSRASSRATPSSRTPPRSSTPSRGTRSGGGRRPAPTAEIVDAVSWDEPTEVELVPLAEDARDADTGTDTDTETDDRQQLRTRRASSRRPSRSSPRSSARAGPTPRSPRCRSAARRWTTTTA